MEKKSKIELVVKKLSFAEAEEEDDLYWANTTEEERLNTLYDLRKMSLNQNKKIEKVVSKRSLYEEEPDQIGRCT